MKSIWGLYYITKCILLLDHLHKYHQGNGPHKPLIMYLHIVMDSMGILIRMSKLNYQQNNLQGIAKDICNWIHRQKNWLGSLLHKMLYHSLRMYPNANNFIHIDGLCSHQMCL